MRGFFVVLAESMTNHYATKTGGSNSNHVHSPQSNNGSGVLIPKFSSLNGEQMSPYSSQQLDFNDRAWDDGDHWAPRNTTHEMTNVSGQNRNPKDGGIWVTETISIDRGSDPYRKERKVLGI